MLRAGTRFVVAAARGLSLGLLAACFLPPAIAADASAAARIQSAARATKPPAKPAAAKPAAAQHPEHPLFGHERASQDARAVAEWIVEEGDNHAGDGHRLLPFAILDKKDARVYVFHADGKLVGAKSGGEYVPREKSPLATPSGTIPAI